MLNYYEHVGILEARLETLEEYKARMGDKPGLFGQGRRRKYYSPSTVPPSPADNKNYTKTYVKFNWEELGISPPNYEYPL